MVNQQATDFDVYRRKFSCAGWVISRAAGQAIRRATGQVSDARTGRLVTGVWRACGAWTWQAAGAHPGQVGDQHGAWWELANEQRAAHLSRPRQLSI